MKNSLIIAATFAIVATVPGPSPVLAGATHPGTPTTPSYYSNPPGPPPIIYKATCETAVGFGLMAFSDSTALVNRIRRAIAAGRTVKVDVENTRITRVSPNGAMHVIAVVPGPDGRPVICYQSF